ncbi:MAG: ribosome biogenesis GTPase YlqF [Clostridiales Family XIII bacterium]|jgi:ribosome biogenesis GTPase A|nr:ribosome biogenesis GTPase YlqF [Clostridiales Family XIII bacterium]
MDNINWYPGHMKKTRELIRENMKLVDTVLEIVDARIPISGRNPILDELSQGKNRFILLNKSDLANETENEGWLKYFRASGENARLLNSMSGAGVGSLLRALSVSRNDRNGKALRTARRMMVVGVPNVGKSSLINRLVGRRSAGVGDRPGITKGKQWLGLENGMQLLDTPGILLPKFEDRTVGLNLAFCGSVKDEILDTEELAVELLRTLLAVPGHANLLAARYRLERLDESGADDESPAGGAVSVLEAIAANRGFVLPGRRLDCDRAAKTLLDEFRGGMIGRITLEKAPTFRRLS